MEIYEAASTRKGDWSLIFVKEHWWAGRHGNDIRTTQWAKPMRGERRVVMAWFKERQKHFDA